MAAKVAYFIAIKHVSDLLNHVYRFHMYFGVQIDMDDAKTQIGTQRILPIYLQKRE